MPNAQNSSKVCSDALPLVNRDNPWPGLSPFDEATSGYFFGRENETVELERLIRRDTLSIVYGQSGLGKTSLLRAGLMPRLRQEGYLPVYLRLAHDETSPALAEQVKAALAEALAAAHVDVRAPRVTETLWEYFHRADLEFWSPRNRRLVPVVMLDQFEELFTVGRQTAGQRARATAFLDELACLATGRASASVQARLDAAPEEAAAFDYERRSAKVLLSLREDYLPEFESLREPCRWNAQNRFRLRRMTGEQAWDVVAKPGAGLVDDAVTARIVDFVSSSRGQPADIVHTRGELSHREVEPALLSVVCRELNNRRLTLRQRTITADLLFGSKEDITRGFYESALADQPPGVRTFVEEELLTGSGFRKRAALEDALKTPDVTPDAVRALVNRRLLRQEESGGVVWIELTHDLLTDVVQKSRHERHHREAQQEAARSAHIAETEKKRRIEAERLTAIARTAREEAEALVVFLVTEVVPKLDAREHLHVLSPLADRLDRHFNALDRDDMSQALLRHAAKTYLCVANVRDREVRFDAVAESCRHAIDCLERFSQDWTLPDRLLAGSALQQLGNVLLQELDCPEKGMDALSRAVKHLAPCKTSDEPLVEPYRRTVQRCAEAMERNGRKDEARALRLEERQCLAEFAGCQPLAQGELNSLTSKLPRGYLIPSLPLTLAPGGLNTITSSLTGMDRFEDSRASILLAARSAGLSALSLGSTPDQGVNRLLASFLEPDAETTTAPEDTEEPWTPESETLHRSMLELRTREVQAHPGDIRRECVQAEASLLLGALLTRKPASVQEGRDLVLSAFLTLQRIEQGEGRRIPHRYRPAWNRARRTCADRLIALAEADDVEALRRLIEAGLPVDLQNERLRTAAMSAAAKGKLTALRYLLNAGAAISIRNSMTGNALLWASQEGQTEAVRILLEHGADIEVAMNGGGRALMAAAKHGHVETGKLLLDRGAEIDARKDGGGTALWVATFYGRADFCRLLLERGAELDTRDSDGYTPLMMACNNSDHDQVDTVALLLDKGASIEATSKNGFRVLMLAASHGHVETGKLLLDRGTEIDAKKADGVTALIVAAANGRVDFCRLLLERDAGLDVRDSNGYTPLMWACNVADRDQADTLALLLDKGAAIEAAGKDGWRALMVAAQHGHVDTGKLLLDRGAEIDAKKDGGGTALWVAAFNGRAEFCRLLLEHGAELDVRDSEGCTPLMWACNTAEHDQADTVALLVDKGAAIEAVQKDGFRALMVAASRGHVETGKLLLDRGAEIDAKKDGGGTALWVAAANGRTNFCRLLLERGAELDVRTSDGYTPLMWACNKAERDQAETVALLLDKGAAIEAASKDGWRAVMLAASHGHVETGKLLLDWGAEIDVRNDGGGTALSVAAFNGRVEFCRLLLERGADLDVRTSDGHTPLMVACHTAERDQADTVALLLDKGAAIEAASKDGWRALTLAAQHGHVETGKLLLDRGAEIDVRNSDGRTAMIVAASNGRTEFCRLLLEHGAELDVRDSDDYTPLTRACHNAERDQADTVALLLDKGATIEAASKDGWRALMLAALRGHVETGKLLLDRGAEIDVRNNDGRTALIVAAFNGRADFCRLLLERCAKLDVRDSDDYTPLMHSCNGSERDQADTVVLLLDKGASIKAAGKNGWHALMIAAEHGHVATGKLLLDRGAEIDARKADGGTAVSVAAANGRADFCRLLIENGANKQVQCIRGYTPATWASGAANIPELLPALFDVEAFSVEAVREKCGNTPDTLPIIIAALVCASDLASREKAFTVAREQLGTALSEIAGRATDSVAPVLRHLVLPRLVSVCGAMQDYAAQAAFQHDYVKLLRERTGEIDLLAMDLTNELSSLCWWQLLAGAYAAALSAGEECVRRLGGEASSPARLNLAHAYLFYGQFEKAKAIYAKYLGTVFEDGRKWNDELRNDFKLLRATGHDHPELKKIEALLEAGK